MGKLLVCSPHVVRTPVCLCSLLVVCMSLGCVHDGCVHDLDRDSCKDVLPMALWFIPLLKN